MAAHVAPEAVRGGPIAALKDGDQITIDVDTRRLDVALSDGEIAEGAIRLRAAPRADEHVDVAIQKYARLVGSAAEGRSLAASCYPAGIRRAGALNAFGALEHRHVAGVREDHLARTGDQLGEYVGVAARVIT